MLRRRWNKTRFNVLLFKQTCNDLRSECETNCLNPNFSHFQDSEMVIAIVAVILGAALLQSNVYVLLRFLKGGLWTLNHKQKELSLQVNGVIYVSCAFCYSVPCLCSVSICFLMGRPWPLFCSFLSFQTLQFLQICEKCPYC